MLNIETPAATLSGYLQHKGRKTFIPFYWRRWYCVLNGSLLLFYKSESDYLKLGKFHDTLDLGLVYDVQTAPGADHDIYISTHNGPQWLRARDKETHRMWLEALQATIVLRREDNKGDEVLKIARKSSRKQKARSVASTVKEVPSSKSLQKGGSQPIFRFSLDFIPGQGKKYPTHDGLNLPSSEISTGEKQTKVDDDEIVVLKEDQQISTEKSPSTKNKFRPTSQSLSSFIMLHRSSSNKSVNSCSPKLLRNNRSSINKPRIPTSLAVGKLVAQLQFGSQKSIKVDENQKKGLERKASSSLNNLKVTNNEDVKLSKRASSLDDRATPLIEISKESSSILDDEPVVNREKEPSVGKETKKKRNTAQRRSSFAAIKQFFVTSSSKIFKRNKSDENPSASKSRSASVESDGKRVQCEQTQNTNRQLLSQISEQSTSTVQEDPCVSVSTYTYEARVLEVLEPKDEQKTPEDSDDSSVELQEFMGASNQPVIRQKLPDIIRTDSGSSLMKPVMAEMDYITSQDQSRPDIPLKTKMKCPSPDYDVPRNLITPIPFTEEEEVSESSTLQVPVIRPKSKQENEVKRISFAQAETEIVTEEIAEDISH